eukprot:scaffold451800_cov24-Prasinocladus_malaysianus.AAC.1
MGRSEIIQKLVRVAASTRTMDGAQRATCLECLRGTVAPESLCSSATAFFCVGRRPEKDLATKSRLGRNQSPRNLCCACFPADRITRIWCTTTDYKYE